MQLCLAGEMLRPVLLQDRLTSLDLSHNNIRDEGATIIANCLPRCSRLVSLDLRGCSIGDAGLNAVLQAVAGENRNPGGLQQLLLWGNSFGSASCQSVHDLQDGSVADGMPAPITMDVTTHVTDGRPQIAQVQPMCAVV